MPRIGWKRTGKKKEEDPPKKDASADFGDDWVGGGAASRPVATPHEAVTSGKRNDGTFPPISCPEIQMGQLTRWHRERWASRENPRPAADADAQRTMYDQILTHVDGTVMERYQGNKPPLEQTFKVTPDTFEITVMSPGGGQKGTTKIDIGNICEIRRGVEALRCQEFTTCNGYGRAKDQAEFAFTILYGDQFRLKQLCLVAQTTEDFRAWTDGLEQWTRDVTPDLYSTDMIQQRWLKKSWNSLQRDSGSGTATDHVGVREFKVWLQRANLKLATKETKDNFNSVDTYREGKIGFSQFQELYHDLCDVADITQELDHFSTDVARQTMSAADLIRFYREQYREELSEVAAASVIRRYGRGGKLKVADFAEFLHGNENEIWDPERLRAVYQDMTQPLTHYFHASSHNTYLMGDQFRSQSSVEAYIRPLRAGCRCVEIDTWNGDGEPVVYHGRTLTSKIKFRDVLPVIVEHGFVTSQYPIILSMENHCNVDQQGFMAERFQAEFRDSLLTRPPAGPHSARTYASPAELMYKVIVKHKKLAAGQTEIETKREDGDEDLSDSILSGYLKLMEIDGSWTRHFFTLTADKLSYADNQDFEDELKAAQEEETSEVMLVGDGKETELHYGEAWFHGKLKDGSARPQGRKIAERLLLDHKRTNPDADHNGLFLVRESDTYPGEFSLSFWRTEEEKIEHCRIRCRSLKFFLTDQVAFINLYELIEYYRREPLKSASFKILLGNSVPQPAAHLHEKWYHEKASRAEAEDMLRRVRADGAYLVRPSQTDAGLSISFRAEGKIKHCRVKKEGRMYCIGDTEFATMIDMIEYYQKQPLYRKMRLRFAVCEELLKDQEEPPEEDMYSSQSLYQTPNSVAMAMAAARGGGAAGPSPEDGVVVRALFAYRAAQKDELSFPVDALITHVEKMDGGWWKGTYGEMSGWLPSNYVKELDNQVVKEEVAVVEDADPLGVLQKSFLSVHGLHVEPRPSLKDQRLIFRIVPADGQKPLDVGAEDEETMKEWAIKIEEARKAFEARKGDRAKASKKMKINEHLSDLIFYCTSVKFKDFGKSAAGGYELMSSFGETKAAKTVAQKTNQMVDFVRYNTRNFARVYPAGRRVDSSNYDPQPMWNCGLQLVALNYQTADRPMWINHGKFKPNARSGYILKPAVMRNPATVFNPFDVSTWADHEQPMTVTVKIISARHLVKAGKGVASPYVQVDICGVEADANSNTKRTQVVPDNGFRPVWNRTMTFEIAMPELACICFTVFDEDMFGDSSAIGQAVLPFGSAEHPCLREGYRSVQLQNIHSNVQELSALLVHIKMERKRPDGEYLETQELKTDLVSKKAALQDLIRARGMAGANTVDTDMRMDELQGQIRELSLALMDRDDIQAGGGSALDGRQAIIRSSELL